VFLNDLSVPGERLFKFCGGWVVGGLVKETGTEITAAVILTPSLYLFNKQNTTIGLVGHYYLAS